MWQSLMAKYTSDVYQILIAVLGNVVRQETDVNVSSPKEVNVTCFDNSWEISVLVPLEVRARAQQMNSL